MPTYTFYIVKNSVMTFDAGDEEFTFSAGYDYADDRYRVVVTDDDTTMDATGDTNQTALIYDMDDNLIDSGVIEVPQYAELTGPGGTIYIDRIEIDGVHYGYLPGDDLTPGGVYSVEDTGTDSLDHTYFEGNSVPCFAPDTMIMTRAGEVPIQWLRQGDLVLTLDHGYQPIAWVGRWRVSWMQLRKSRSHWPVTIHPDASCADDARPLTVSAAHKVLVRDSWFELNTSNAEVLCNSGFITPAREPAAGQSLVWHHILLDRDEIIQANGQWSESLFSGGSVFDDLPADMQTAALAHSGGHHTTTARQSLRRYEAAAYLAETNARQMRPTG